MSKMVVAFAMLLSLSCARLAAGQDSTAPHADSDSVPVAVSDSGEASRQPTMVGVVVTGALAWYPGAVVGAFAGLGLPVRHCAGCEYAALPNIALGAVAGGGATAGLAVGGVASAMTACSHGKRLARGILGGEIGSFGGALLTGVVGASTGGLGLAAAPLVIPVASAVVAAVFVRRCQ